MRKKLRGIDGKLLQKWEAELPRLAKLNQGIRLGAERLIELSDKLAKAALKRQDAARRKMENARTDLDRQAAEGEYLHAVDDRQKALIVHAAATKNLSEHARG